MCISVCMFLDPIQRGETALYEACRNGHDEVVKILLQAGADPNIQEDEVSDHIQGLITYSLHLYLNVFS